MRSTLGSLTIVSALFLLVGIFLGSVQTEAQVSVAEHVYYGHVPVQTFTFQFPLVVDELIGGKVNRYDVPQSHAILDVVGLEAGTSIEVWDIFLNQRIYSTVVGKFEKKVVFIRDGTFFKIVSSKRIAALLNGGFNLFNTQQVAPAGTSTFYPALTGGFRGREFIFNAAPATHPQAYSVDRIGYNFYLFALEETDWQLEDSVQVWSTSGHLPPRGIKTTLLQSRVNAMETHGGAGNDVVFHLTTGGDAQVSSCTLGDFVAVSAVTGGYVGKVFFAPIAVTLEEAGRTAAFIIIPLEEGEVKIYDKDLNVIATHSFTESDVVGMHYWYHELGVGRFNTIVESTGDVTFTVGQTEGSVGIEYLSDDITFMGARPGQELRFYAPTKAVIFAPENLTITIDAGTPIQMEKDSFKVLESGIHSVSANKHVIIEIMAASTFWDDWGSYLIEPSDLDVNFEVPGAFWSRPTDYTLYIAGFAVAVIGLLVFFVMRRRRAIRV